MSDMMDGMTWGMTGWMALWGLVGLVLVVFLVAATVRLLRWPDAPQAEPRRDAAHELLRGRYAAGEIDEEEYRRREDGLDVNMSRH